jgi:hypothetical protein
MHLCWVLSCRLFRQQAKGVTNTTAFPAAAISSSLIVADPIASWTTLETSITAAAGKAATLTLSSATFDMGGFRKEIVIFTAQTHITTIGNGATFDAGGKAGMYATERFFTFGKDVMMVMSHITLTDTQLDEGNGGAIYVDTGGSITATSCTFSGNLDDYTDGAIYVNTGGSITATSCTFAANDATSNGKGGALYFAASSTGLLKDCSFTAPVSAQNNDIARADTTANVTFACADGLVGHAQIHRPGAGVLEPSREFWNRQLCRFAAQFVWAYACAQGSFGTSR